MRGTWRNILLQHLDSYFGLKSINTSETSKDLAIWGIFNYNQSKRTSPIIKKRNLTSVMLFRDPERNRFKNAEDGFTVLKVSWTWICFSASPKPFLDASTYDHMFIIRGSKSYGNDIKKWKCIYFHCVVMCLGAVIDL